MPVLQPSVTFQAELEALAPTHQVPLGWPMWLLSPSALFADVTVPITGTGERGGQFPRLLLASAAAHSDTPASSKLAVPSFSHWEQRMARQPGQLGPVSTLLHPSLQGLLVQDGGSHGERRERAPSQTHLHLGRLLPRLQSAELGPSEGCHPPLAQAP